MKQPRMSRATLERQRPTRISGFGPPLMVGHGNTRRLLAEGGGLCSPGLWPPERRFPLQGFAARVHASLEFELSAFGRSAPKGLEGVLGDLIAGRTHEDPFPQEATQRLYSFLKDITREIEIPLPRAGSCRPNRWT